MTIFEKIIAREIPAPILYEDEHVISFLDSKPNNKGHALVVPKKKFVNIFDADEEVLARMIIVAKKIADSLVKTVNATGVNIVMNNGEDANQAVFHGHIHVIPRYKDDGRFYGEWQHVVYADGEADDLVEKIKTAIA